MTEPGAVRVTVARVCPACEGQKRFGMKRHENDNDVWYQNCLRCGGAGVVWEPVTCASCKHFGPFNETAGWRGFWMSSTVGGVPCAKWEPREP